MTTFDEVAIFIAEHIDMNPVCIETGTAYGFPPGNPYWNTTSCIVKRICEPCNGYLHSIDLEDRSENIDKLFKLGNTDRKKVKLYQGESVEVLANLVQTPYFKAFGIRLLCLDSGESEDLLLNEYLTAAPELKARHYVLVDDVMNSNSVKYKKVVPYLQSLGYAWTIIPTETGLFVASKGYPIPCQ